ncbi:MAG: hypothetical protein ABEJ04_06570 [Halobacteriaceae archaeon]
MKNQILHRGIKQARRLEERLDLPASITEAAKSRLREAQREGLIQGHTVEEVATAIVYATCRERGVARGLCETAAAGNVDCDTVGKAFRRLSRDLGLEIQPLAAAEYVPHLCDVLGQPEAVAAAAVELLDSPGGESAYTGYSPPALAAAAIYLAATERETGLTQSEAADVAHVSTVTIRNHCSELRTAATEPEAEDGRRERADTG